MIQSDTYVNILVYHFISLKGVKMDSKELIKKAFGRLEAMDEAIKMTIESLNDIYADRQLVYYLLYLSEKENNKKCENM